MTQQEMIKAARRQIEEKRQRAESEAQLKRRQMAQQIPELETLTFQQAQAGAAAAGMAAAGNAEGAKEKLQELHGIRQRRAELLRQRGFSEDDLSPRYTCKLCNDTGKDGNGFCTCLLEEVKRMRRASINDAGPLTLCRFETFRIERYPEKMEGVETSPRQLMTMIFSACKDYAADFGPRSQSLLMYGNAGLGKTHLALSIAAEVLEKGHDVIYVSAQNAFAAVSGERYSGKNELFTSMLEADLLVLDDLGTEYIDAYVLSRLYELINSRMNRRPTIYTTNICQQEMLTRRYTEKIASRLLGDCHRMAFKGQDLRLSRAAMS